MIRPLSIDETGNCVELIHDREEINGAVTGGHTGTVDLADLVHPRQENGDLDYTRLLFPCPDQECLVYSDQPVGGGGLAEVDRMTLRDIFIIHQMSDGSTLAEAIEDVDAMIREDRGTPVAPLGDVPEEAPQPALEAPVPMMNPRLADEMHQTITTTLEKTAKANTLSPIMSELLTYLYAQVGANQSMVELLTNIDRVALATQESASDA